MTEPRDPPPLPEDPDHNRWRWRDWPIWKHFPPFRNHLPHFQPGMPFPQPPGQQDWGDDLTTV